MAHEPMIQPMGGAALQASVDVYVGPRPFRTGEMLFGRDAETDDLEGLLISQRLVLLHSPSGAGKTSLIHAKLMPALQDKFLMPRRVSPDDATPQLVVIRLNRLPEPADPPGSNRYLISTLLSLEQYRPEAMRRSVASLADMTLDEYFAELQARLSREQGPLPLSSAKEASPPTFRPLLLIFDQFEELLTLDPTDEAAKWSFIRQLGQALLNEERWALFAIRQDFLGALDPYLPAFPNRLAATYHLDLLRAEVAAATIVQPAQFAGVAYEDGFIERLITDLRQVNVQQPDGSFTHKPGSYIEPVQLQVVCQSLWQVRKDPHIIRQMDLEALGGGKDVGVDGTLAAYYAENVSRAARAGKLDERRVRNWFDKQLITAQGVRRPVLVNEALAFGLDEPCLHALDMAFLIRRESHSGAQWYELSHDRLVAPVISDNKEWRDVHLNAFQRQAEVWEESGRRSDLLVRGEVLAEGRQWAEAHPEELTAADQTFLEACQEARSRRRSRVIMGVAFGGCAVSLVMGILLAIAVWQYHAANKSREATEAAKRQTEETWARELFRPLGRQPGELNPVEVSALTALAGLPEAQWPVRVRFVQRALAEPDNARRFVKRLPVAMQAALGLDRALAVQTAEILRERLKNPDESIQTAAALAVAQLDLADEAISEGAARVLAEALAKQSGLTAPATLARGLVDVSKAFPSEAVAKLLAEALVKESDPDACKALVDRLVEVCKVLSPDQGAKILTEALIRESQPYARQTLAGGLAAVCKSLPAARAATCLNPVAKVLAEALVKESDPDACKALADRLAEVCKVLPPDQGAKLLADALTRESHPHAHQTLAGGLVEVCKVLPPDQGAKILTEALIRESQPYARQTLAGGLAAVCKSLPAARAATCLNPVAKVLAEALTWESHPYARQALVGGLVEVCKVLPPDQGAKLLADALTRESDPYARQALAGGLVEVCKVLPPDQGAKILTEALIRESHPYAHQTLAGGLAAVCKTLPADQAVIHLERAAKVLAEALVKESDPDACKALAGGLAEVCKVLPPDQGAKLLADALTRESDPYARQALAGGLAEVSKALPADRAATHLKPAATALAEALAKAEGYSTGRALVSDFSYRQALADGLAQVCKAFPPDQGAKILAEALGKESVPSAQGDLTHILAEVCKALPANRAATHLKLAAKVLAEALPKESDYYTREVLAGGLVEVCKALPPDQGAKALAEALAKEANPSFQKALARGLAGVCKALSADRAATHLDPVAKARSEALAKASDPSAQASLAGDLAEVCKALPADKAATHLKLAAKILAEALPKESDYYTREVLAGGLVEVCKALPPDQGAKALAEALAKASNFSTQEALARGLAEVCKALPPDRAATHLDPAAKALTEALAKASDPSAQAFRAHGATLAGGLAEVCKALPADRATPHLLLSLAQYPQYQDQFIPTLSEVAKRSCLPDSIEALKHPLCYGKARQVYLRQVECLACQQFKTRWEMAQWLTKNHPEINLSTPPRGLE